MMLRSTTSMPVLDCEITDIRLLLERYAGVLLDKSSEVLAPIISEYLEAQHIGSAAELIALLHQSPSQCNGLLERVLVSDTGFFRFPAVFDAFARRVIPEVRARKSEQGSSSLRIWSAGCASGEEAYSIAMTVCEVLNGRGVGNIHIVASDIRDSAIATAQRGLFHRTAVQTLPKHLVGAYFSRVADHFLVKPRLRNLVTFTEMNLADPSFIGRFDCIFCMDVLPRFSASQRSALLQRLHMYLEPGGYLFLGEREKISTKDVSLTPQSYLGYTYYQRPFAAAAKSGR